MPNCACDHKTSEATPWQGGKQLVPPFWHVCPLKTCFKGHHWRWCAKRIGNWNKHAMLISEFLPPKNPDQMGIEKELQWKGIKEGRNISLKSIEDNFQVMPYTINQNCGLLYGLSKQRPCIKKSWAQQESTKEIIDMNPNKPMCHLQCLRTHEIVLLTI